MSIFGRSNRPAQLTLLAAELQAVIFAMPAHERAQAIQTVRAMFQTAHGLQIIPEAAGSIIGRMIGEVALKLAPPMPRKPQELFKLVDLGAHELILEFDIIGTFGAET